MSSIELTVSVSALRFEMCLLISESLLCLLLFFFFAFVRYLGQPCCVRVCFINTIYLLTLLTSEPLIQSNCRYRCCDKHNWSVWSTFRVCTATICLVPKIPCTRKRKMLQTMSCKPEMRGTSFSHLHDFPLGRVCGCSETVTFWHHLVSQKQFTHSVQCGLSHDQPGWMMVV